MGLGLCLSKIYVQFLLILLLGLCACQIEKPVVKEGPIAAVLDKDMAVIEGFGNRDYRDSKVGEWVLTEITQSAFSGPLTVTGYILRQMRAIERNGKKWKFKIMTNDIVVLRDNTLQENPYVDEIVAEEEGDPVPLSLANQKLQNIIAQYQPKSTIRPYGSGSAGFAPCLPVSSGMLEELTPGYHVTYHSLTLSNVDQAPPQLVQKAAQCQGLVGCKMKVRKILYDEVLRHEMGGVERYRCEFEFSDDVPYLGQMARRCIHFMAKVEDREIPIEVCLSLANFERESASPQPPPTKP